MTLALPPEGGALAPASDLASLLAGERPDDGPKLLIRSDGQPLLYPGALNTLFGEPGAGKTWVAYLAALAMTEAGGHVLYIDAESTAQATAARLADLGANPEQVDRFAYHVLEGPLGLGEVSWLCQQVEERPVDLVVVDSLGEMLGASGVDGNSDAETARFLAEKVRPLARRGACVLLLDHVVKRSDERGRWAIGSQRKLAAVDGVALALEIVVPWAKSRSGTARAVLAKDRRGWVGAVGESVAEVRFDAWADGRLSVRLEAPAKSEDRLLPGTAAHVVSALEAAGGRWGSVAEAQGFLELPDAGTRAALRRAVEAGQVIEEIGPHGAKAYRLPSPALGPVEEGPEPFF